MVALMVAPMAVPTMTPTMTLMVAQAQEQMTMRLPMTMRAQVLRGALRVHQVHRALVLEGSVVRMISVHHLDAIVEIHWTSVWQRAA